MFGLGTQELMVILVIAMLLFGVQKLPELARGLGKSVKEFQKATSGQDEPEPKTPASAAPASAAATRLCASCQTALQTEWSHCPHCGAAVTTASAGTAAA